MQHFASSLVRISERLESMNMLIDRTFSDITASRIGDLESAKPLEKSREEEYSDSDFFHEISIEMLHAHGSGIERECIPDKCHYYIQRSDNIEKCHHITDTGDIVEGILFKKKSTSDEWQGCIFGARDIYTTREDLRSREREHDRTTKR